MKNCDIKDSVRVTYALKFPKGLNVSGKCASVLYPRDWWEKRKKELNDPTGRRVMDEAFRITVMCPYIVTNLEIDEHPIV